MELTQNALLFFKGIGANPDTIKKLLSEEESDIDVQKLINDHKNVTKAIYKGDFEKEFKETLNVEYGKTLIKVMRDLNKTFELGLTSEQIKDTNYEDFIEKSKELIFSKNEGGSDEANKKIVDLQNKYDSSINKLKQEYEEKLFSTEANLKKYVSKTEFLSRWNNKTLGVPDPQRDFYKEAFYKELSDSFEIQEGNKILNKDGTKVMNPDNNGFWETIDDYIDHKINVLGIGKRSGGTETATATNGTGPVAVQTHSADANSSAAQKLAARAAAQGIRVS